MSRKSFVSIAILGLATALVACEGPEPEPAPRWLDDPSRPAPEWLSQTGLYADVEGSVPGEGVHRFTPPQRLWSGGSVKERLLYLPPGGRIRTDGPVWEFPVGTVLSKSFGYLEVEGLDGVVPIETRLLWRTAAGWRYAVYLWNTDGTEARRYPDRWDETPLALHPNARGAAPLRHTVPGLGDCAACHDAPGQKVVLGIDPLNVPAELVEARVFAPAVAPQALPAQDPREAAAMGYLVANCGHCHHGRRGAHENASFSLLPEDLVANTVNRPTESSASGAGIRVIPGDPAGSALYQAVALAREPGYGGDIKPMPPLGIDRVDPAAEEILRAWILSLAEKAP